MDEEQQYCLRWNNFQANITSQFEALRDDEDFTDVTLACDGQRVQAHKVVLSACSPLFKELFKNNPCPHPIIFMRDVEARSITALLEFMYAGEVNVAQAHLSGFLRTAESLKIRGLTEPNTDLIRNKKDANASMEVSTSKQTRAERVIEPSPVRDEEEYEEEINDDDKRLKEFEAALNDNNNETNANHNHNLSQDDGDLTDLQEITVRQVKEEFPELPEYPSDVDEVRETKFVNHRVAMSGIAAMDISRTSLAHFNAGLEHKFGASGGFAAIRNGKVHSQERRTCDECGRTYSNLSNLKQHMKLVHFPTHPACCLCNKQFKTDLYLRRHMSNAHDKYGSTTPPWASHKLETNVPYIPNLHTKVLRSTRSCLYQL